MTVYVDDMFRLQIGRLGRMRMSHMIADTTPELIEMATKIGIDPRHIQKAGTDNEHFDVCLEKRTAAVQLGAVEVTMKELVRMIVKRRIK